MSAETVQHVRFVDGEAGVSQQTQPPTMGTSPPPYSTPVPQSFPWNETRTNEKDLTYDQVFTVEDSKGSRFHDIWASVLFVGVVAGFVVVSIMVGHDIPRSNTLHPSTWHALLFVPLVAFCLSLAYLLIVNHFPKGVIYVTSILHTILCVILGVLFFTLWSSEDPFSICLGCLFLISGVVSALCLCFWRSRVPYSVIMLRTTTSIAMRYGHMFLTSFLGALLTIGITMWYTFTLLGLIYNQSNGMEKGNIGLIIFISFAFYWITEVIKNVIHVTVSGVYGSWYFCIGKQCGFPSHATRSAFRRATTYSFGSISFGSLLVTIIRILERFAQSAGQSSGQGDACQIMVVCIARLLLLFLQTLVEFINEYAFSYIALFGTSYISAAKSTWRLLKDRGITLLINECLIDPVLSMGAFFVGSVCFAMAYLLTGSQHDMSWVAIWAFFVGAQIANVFLAPIKSGVTTLFVAMAYEPEVMVKEHPDLYKSIAEIYPHIATAIHAYEGARH